MSFPSIDAFLAHLATMPAALHAAERKGETIAGEKLVEHATSLIGTEPDAWRALADATIAEKQRLGYTGRVSATDPLLREGTLRDSIGFTADQAGVTLGSTDPVAVYQELGTGRIPPRPFLSSTMFQHGHAAADTIAEHVTAALASAPMPARKA